MKRKIPPNPPPVVSSSSEQALDGRGSDRLAGCYNLLVPIDFSEHSKTTIKYATQLAARTGGSLKVLHVFQMSEYPAALYQGPYTEHSEIKTYVETAKLEASSQLALVIEQIVAKGLEAEPVLRVGNPYEEIVSAAEEMRVNLIVIGFHGRAGLGRFLLGSTAERVLQYAPCPVLIVKETLDRQ